jgi:hypothetical protein
MDERKTNVEKSEPAPEMLLIGGHGWPFGCFRSRSAAGEWRLNQAAFMDERIPMP